MRKKYFKNSTLIILLILGAFLFITQNSYAQCVGPANDCDNDGVVNSLDLDDDNDGILDTQEGLCTALSGFDWNGQTVSSTVPSTTTSTINGNLVTVNFSGNGWGAANPSLSTGGNARNLFDDDDVNGTGNGDDAVLITRSDNGDVYNPTTENNRIDTDVVFSIPVDVLKFSFADVDFSDFISIYAVDVNGNTVFPNYTVPSGFTAQWTIYEPTDVNNPVPNRRTVVGDGQNTNTAGSTVYVDFDGNAQITQLFIRSGYVDADGLYDIPDANNNPGGTNQINSFILAGDYLFCNSLDTDNDGIPDYLDVDSDNDGCPDAIEASGGTNEYVLADLLANNSINTTSYPVGTDGVPGPSAATSAPQGVGSSIDANVIVCCNTSDSGFLDKDGDDVTDICDLDDDNDGILDSVELRCDQPTEANPNSGTGSLQDQLYLFNWTDPSFADGLDVNDTQTFNLPSELQIVATVTSVTINNPPSPPLEPYVLSDLMTWAQADFAQRYNAPGDKEVFYLYNGTGIDITMSFVATKNGIPYPLDLLAIDPESTGDTPGTSNDEQMIFTTNGENWEFVETIHTQGGTNGTYTLSGKTLIADETFLTGSSLYVSNNASEIRIQVNHLSSSTGREGFAYGIYLRCDTDNDGVPDHLDTDSDNDGCPDAVEGAGTILSDDNDLTSLMSGSNGVGSSMLNLGTTSNTNGSPIYPSSGSIGFTQATAAAVKDITINSCLADLSLTKTVDKAIVKVNDTIMYRLTIRNDGISIANGVQVTDVLPTGVTYQMHTVSRADTTYEDSDLNSVRDLWNIGTLNLNETITLQITATVNGAGEIVNKSQITQSNQADSDSATSNGN